MLEARNINKYTTPQYQAPMNSAAITNSNIFPKLNYIYKKRIKMELDTFINFKEKFSINVRIYHPPYEHVSYGMNASISKLTVVLLLEQDGMKVPICFVSRVNKNYLKIV